jgi:hypothetical protein
MGEAMATDPTTALLGASMAAIASIVAASLAFFSNRKTFLEQTKLEKLRADTQRDLENLRDQIAASASERNARVAYEFEARKKLYSESGPAMFQFFENSSYMINRIKNIARASRDGQLPTWLDGSDHYYLHSTIHSFLAPLASIYILRERLTLLDLSLDEAIERNYEIGKSINRSFNRDFYFAQASPVIRYQPDDDKRSESNSVVQGVYSGNIQRAVAALVATEDNAKFVKSFSEFSAELQKPGSATEQAVDPFITLLKGFSPIGRPVLWRILICQLFLYRAARLYRVANLTNSELIRRVQLTPEEKLEYAFSVNAADSIEVEAGFRIGIEYLTKSLDFRDKFAAS